MTSNLALKVGRKLFEKNLRQYTPEDPLYETYTDAKGREKRRKRELPPGLSARDAKILKSVKKRAHRLDKGFSICGMRFGWTFIIGIIPGAGDVAAILLNHFLVVRKARQAEIPSWLLRKMLVNNAASAMVGFIPIVGDILLAVFKANSRNAALFEEFLRIRGEEFLKMENERVQNPDDVRPGAGRKSGENVPGKERQKDAEKNGGGGGAAGGGWFKRKRSKGKDVTPRPVLNGESRESRFIEEDVQPEMTESSTRRK